MANFTNSLSQDELREKIKQIIARDSSRLANTNYSPYPGKTLSPMSSLTQRAQLLDEQRSSKGMPYQNSLSKIANSPIKGISPGDLQTILGNLKNKHTGFGQNVVGGRLSKQFGSAYDPYRNKFESRLNKDTDLKLGETKGDIENLNSTIRNLESKRNNSIFDVVSNSAKGKNARQQGLIGMLGEFGQQKHGINNKILTGEKARFEAERNDPYERLQNLQQALHGIDGEEDHPDLSAQNAEQLKKALIAYGIDVGKPVDSWGHNQSIHTPTYQGKLVEPINAEMNSSYRLAEEIDPKYQDKNYASRKNLRKDLVNSSNGLHNVVNELPSKLDPRFALLDAEAKKKAKMDMTALNAKYIKRGMYGGQSHIQSASDRMREINDATFGARSNVLKNELGQGITDNHSDSINKAHKLSQYDQLANTEFGDMLGDIKRTNTTGLEKWKNDQVGNEQLYKAYQNEKAYQQPRLLGNARATGADMGIGGMFSHFANQGIDLNSISDLQNKYNNLEKELSTANNKIKNQNDYNLQKKMIQEQEQRLAAERNRQAKINAENQRRLEDERKRQVQNAKSTSLADKYAQHQQQQLQNRYSAFDALPRLYKDTLLNKWTGSYPNTGPDPVASNYKQYMTYARQMGENPNDPSSWRTYSRTHW